jgi:hypothetical protein
MIQEITKEQIEEYKQSLRDFLVLPAFAFVRSTYISKQQSMLENLVRISLQNDLSKINILAGEIKGFKEGFELIESIGKEVK